MRGILQVDHSWPYRRRNTLRLPGHDYSSPGAYFVTTCTHGRVCLFGDIQGDEMHVNALGRVVERCWYQLPNHYPNVEVDAFVVMPNHIHGIILLVGDDGVPVSKRLRAHKRHALPEIVRGFKTFSARGINGIGSTRGVPVWERTFYERIVGDGVALQAIRRYIANNPAQWAMDAENPDRRGSRGASPG